MGDYKFRLPDIGEGIAEAEIVAWHVKVGDRVEEDQQLADMMTDKATVEMESPVAGTVVELAGEVGDEIAIGSVLVVIETEGGAPAEAAPAAESKAEIPIADGAERPTKQQKEAMPSVAHAPAEPAPAPKADPAPAKPRSEPAPAPAASHAKVLASPAVRQRARDLGIDLGAGEGHRRPAPPRRSRLLSALQWRQRQPRRRAAAARRTRRSRSSACAAGSPRTWRRPSATSRISPMSRSSTSPSSRTRGR